MPRPILLLTRPQMQAARFAKAVRARSGDRLEAFFAPLMEIRLLPLGVDPAEYAALIFTSENGVAGFAAGSALRDWPVWCVGPRTAEAARAAGFAVVRSAQAGGGDAEALLRLIGQAPAEGRLLHLRGVHAAGEVARRLTQEYGRPCDVALVYDQAPLAMTAQARAALEGQAPVIVPLFSPRSAALAAEALVGVRASFLPVAISAAAAEAWNVLHPGAVPVAPRPDAEAMLEAVHDVASRLVA